MIPRTCYELSIPIGDTHVRLSVNKGYLLFEVVCIIAKVGQAFDAAVSYPSKKKIFPGMMI